MTSAQIQNSWQQLKNGKSLQQLSRYPAISRALQLLPTFRLQFSEIAAPLTRLTEKKTDFHWDLECQIAFDGLKDALFEVPILAYTSVSGLFMVDTDASNTGIGSVRSQAEENEERVIWYASKKLGRAQRQYCHMTGITSCGNNFFAGVRTLYFRPRVCTEN